MGIKSSISKVIQKITGKSSSSPTPSPTTQYSSPIGPSVPIGRDTQGGYVYSPSLSTKDTPSYQAPSYFSDSSGTPTTSRGGGGGGGSITPTQQAQQIQELQAQGLSQQQAIQRAGYTPQQLQASIQQQSRQDFSGQVQVRSPSQRIGEGRLEETQYFVKGKEVGKVRGETAEVSQPAKLTFKTPTQTEEVKLGRQGITQQVTLTPQDVSNVIQEESQAIIKKPEGFWFCFVFP